MKTHTGKINSYLVGNEIYSSDLQGDFYGGFFTMHISDLTPKIKGKDMLYDVMLKELANYKQSIKDGKQVTVHVEWDIKDDYSEYIACRVLGVETSERTE
jgi:hypothetical protein